MRTEMTIVAIIVAVMMVMTPLIPSADADEEQGEYGTYLEITMDDLDAIAVEFTGMTVQELLDTFVQVEGYDIDIVPTVDSGIGLDRITYIKDSTYVIQDKMSGYFEFALGVSASGEFPKAGHYEAKEGEDSFAFLERVFLEEPSEYRSVDADVLMGAYIEAEMSSYIDTVTGEITTAPISLRLMVINLIEGNIAFDMPDDELSLDISYKDYSESNNVYLGLEIELTSDGLKILSSDESWECRPVISSHVSKFMVSSDLAGNVWNLLMDGTEIDDRAKSSIPQLILNIIGSTNRVVDLMDTISSLTSTRLPDMVFTGDFKLSNGQDAYGNDYVDVLIKRSDVSEEMKLWLDAYTIDATKILDIIPSTVMSDTAKGIAAIVMAIFGMDEIHVADISEDEETVEKIENIDDYVDTAITYDETYEFKMPTGYLVTAIVILAIGILVAVFMWRGKE